MMYLFLHPYVGPHQFHTLVVLAAALLLHFIGVAMIAAQLFFVIAHV